MTPFAVYILGSGSAKPVANRSSAAHAVQVRGGTYLIDCAEGTQRELCKNHLPIQTIKAVFLSHLHGDHCFGLPGLLSTMGMLGRTEPLPVFAPEPITEYLNGIKELFLQGNPFAIEVHPITEADPGEIYHDKRISVTAFALDHKVPTYGFKVTEQSVQRHIQPQACQAAGVPFFYYPALQAGKDYITPQGERVANALLTTPAAPGRSYAYCSDTRYMPSLATVVRGVTLLYHEATYLAPMSGHAAQTYHSTAADAARVAADAQVGHLVIGHFSTRYNTPTELVQQAREIFPATGAAQDGMRIDLLSSSPARVSVICPHETH